MNHPFKLVPENFTDEELFQEEQPMPQEPQNYTPEALPGLEQLEQFGEAMAAHARNQKISALMIVRDLRLQINRLNREADTLEGERVQEIDHINRSYMAKMDRNRMMAAEVDAMIAHYTSEPVQQIEPQQLMPPPKRTGLLSRLVKERQSRRKK